MPIYGQIPGGGRPFGGIYQVDTSALDDFSKRMYAQEQQQLAQRQKEAVETEQQFQKTYSNIKPVDQEKFRQMYEAYKKQKIELRKAKGLKGDAFIKKQAEVNQSLANVFSYAQKSIDDKAQLEEIYKRSVQNPNQFDPDAHKITNLRWNTPADRLDQLVAHPTMKDEKGVAKMIDLRDPNNLMWQNTTKWGDVIKKSIGVPIERGAETTFTDPKDNVTQITRKYKAINSPKQIQFELSATALGTRNGTTAITDAFADVMTPDNIIAIPQAYEEWRKKPEVIAAYGNEGTEFPASVWNSQATTAATLKAMQLAMANPPTPVDKPRVNQEKKMDKAQENALSRQYQGYQYSINKMNMWWNLREQSGINVETYADDAYTSDANTANANNGVIPGADPTKKKIIFGTTMGNNEGVMGMDKGGNYTLTDPNGVYQPIIVPASEAKSKIRIARKAAFQPGVKPPGGAKPETKPTGDKPVKIPEGATIGKKN